jgi:serine/threonine-protein kinase
LLRDVAVKHLRPELLADAAMLAQFLWEARVTAYLDHPNIVPIHDLGMNETGELFFTMKLVRGATLETVVAARTESLTRRLRMFLQLCNAIAFAHARGVLHRDLKPANVMVGEFGEIIVTDWGLALPLPGGDDEGLRSALPDGMAKLSAGTPMYMSPEQIRGDALDVRADVYALGVMLYELIALRPPYEAASVPALFAKALQGDAIPLTGASPSLAAVVARAMAVEAGSRYASVDALARDVESVLDGGTPGAERVSLLRRAARYYVARDPAMAGLRVVDIDSWAFSAMLCGLGVAALASRWITLPLWAGIAAFAAALLVGAPATIRWLRLRRR